LQIEYRATTSARNTVGRRTEVLRFTAYGQMSFGQPGDTCPKDIRLEAV
jgi:hypothetical protein